MGEILANSQIRWINVRNCITVFLQALNIWLWGAGRYTLQSYRIKGCIKEMWNEKTAKGGKRTTLKGRFKVHIVIYDLWKFETRLKWGKGHGGFSKWRSTYFFLSFFFKICKVLTNKDCVSKSGLSKLISPAINRFQTLSCSLVAEESNRGLVGVMTVKVRYSLYYINI